MPRPLRSDVASIPRRVPHQRYGHLTEGRDRRLTADDTPGEELAMSLDVMNNSRTTVVLVLWGVVAVLVLLFVITSPESVEMSIGSAEVTFPLWLLVLVTFSRGSLRAG